MTITQTDTVATTLTARSAGMANAVAVATLKSEAAAATPATFYDSDVLENTSAETWNEYEIKSPLGSSYTLENLSTCQSLTAGVVAPVGDGGFGRIRVTDGVVSKILKCDTTKRGGQAFREFVEYSEGSISRYLYDQVGALFDATPDVDYYSTYNHSTSTYTRNASCWAASIDLSCVAVASNSGSGWTRQRGGVLITSRHLLIARHFPYGVGTQVRFCNAAGTVETRTVIGVASTSGEADLWVCTLSSAVTVASPCAIAGTWIAQGRTVANNFASWYSGGGVIHTDQNAKIYAATLGNCVALAKSYSRNVTIGGTTFADCEGEAFADHAESGAIPAEFAGLRHQPVTGDSGQPVFVIIEGEPVLLWTWTSSYSGTPVYLHNGAVLNALIAAADTNASISTGLTITVATDPTA